MKQPRSSSALRSKHLNKPLLPSFRHSRQANKLQQLNGSNKTELFFHTSLTPMDILIDSVTGSSSKCIVSSKEINITGSGDQNKIENLVGKQWVHLVFNGSCRAKVRKIGDENVFGRNCLFWNISDLPSSVKQAHLFTVRIADPSAKIKLPEDRNLQMKNFVANMMAKKPNRKSTQNSNLEVRPSLRRGSGLLKQMAPECFQDKSDGRSSLWKNHASTTSGSVHSQRRQFFQSKILGGKCSQQSEHPKGNSGSLLQSKQTLVGLADNEDYVKRKNKFDSQPYFYQASFLSSQANFDDRSVTAAFSNRQESFKQPHRQSNTLSPIEAQIDKDISCLQNKSLHKSEEEESVAESIHRSGLVEEIQRVESQADNEVWDVTLCKKQKKQKKQKKEKNEEQSSSCYESEELQSSGTLYESKYE